MSDNSQQDAMIARLEKEMSERDAFIQGTIANAQDREGDLTDNERELVTESRKRIESLDEQLDTLREARDRMQKARQKSADVQNEIQKYRHEVDQGPVEYRSAAAYVMDQWDAHTGSRQALERIEVFHRAAAHQKTSDNLGIVPDPIVGDVIRFIDDSRPMVTAIGPKPLSTGTWYRPIVTQEPLVAKQGSAGAAADEKAELVSQKMLISRLTATAVTYGGYVNVSRQNLDFTDGLAMQLVIEGLASNYAIQTETALGTALDASTGTPIGYGASPTAATIRASLWAAAAVVYSAVKGQGRLILAMAPDRLAAFGPLFTPIPTAVAPGEGLVAGEFGTGNVGGISGITAVMSAGLASGKAFLFSTTAMEVFEQRVGTLSVVEPSVLGVQVAYAGYFTPLLISNNGIIELTAS